MSATDRSGLGFSRANTDEQASARDPRGKTQAKVHAFRFLCLGRQGVLTHVACRLALRR